MFLSNKHVSYVLISSLLEESGVGEGGDSDQGNVLSNLGSICIPCIYLVCLFYFSTGAKESIQISAFSKMPCTYFLINIQTSQIGHFKNTGVENGGISIVITENIKCSICYINV